VAAGKGLDWLGSKAETKETAPTWQRMLGSGTHETVNQLPMLLGGLAKAKGDASLPKRQAALDTQKVAEAPLNAIREKSQAAGLTTPVEADSWVAGIPGIAKLSNTISKSNQPKVQKLMAEQFDLPPGTSLTPDAIKTRIREEGNVYAELVKNAENQPKAFKQSPVTKTSPILDASGKPYTSIETPPDIVRTPGMEVTNEFKAKLGKNLQEVDAMINESPETFKSLVPSQSLLKEYIGKSEINPKTALESIKRLRADAQGNLKSTNPAERAAGFTRMEIANGLEDVFEKALETKGDLVSLAKFKKARKTIAQGYDLLKVLDEDGTVNMQALGNIAKRRPLSENLKLVADFAKTFPSAAKTVKEGIYKTSPFDWMFAAGSFAAGHPLAAAAEMGGRVGIPYLAQKGMMQKGTPSYQAGNAGSDAAMYGGVGTSIAAQLDQQRRDRQLIPRPPQ
jgi:hypothetical protein